jgi:hypothetical protein
MDKRSRLRRCNSARNRFAEAVFDGRCHGVVRVYYLILLNNPRNASTGLSMNGKSPII